jgi:exodeoxyribonuclease VII large subunit
MTVQLLLSELNNLIRDVLLDAFPETVWVVAEISEIKENRNGHCYLELIEKDEVTDEITARTRATIWSYSYRMLKPYFETTTGEKLNAGLKILVQASVEFHPAFGLSLNIKDIDPTYTLGDMARRRNEIINRLKDEGIIDMNKELPLPEVPQKIAVISSETAAGYLDFAHQLANNTYGFKFYPKLFPAAMQGTEAVPSIIRALERIFLYDDFFDAVVIIRGGGAQADLSCFDSYELALNIAQFPLPVLTGIGHEKDDTIADLVAHTRLKTPTAVAEFLISGVLRFAEKLAGFEETIVALGREILDTEYLRLERLGNIVARSGNLYVVSKSAEISELSYRLNSEVKQFALKRENHLASVKNQLSANVKFFTAWSENQIEQYRLNMRKRTEFLILSRQNKIGDWMSKLKNSVRIELRDKSADLHLKEKSVELLSPVNILKRGYSLTFKEGKLLKSISGLVENDRITTRFADGEIVSKIENI